MLGFKYKKNIVYTISCILSIPQSHSKKLDVRLENKTVYRLINKIIYYHTDYYLENSKFDYKFMTVTSTIFNL